MIGKTAGHYRITSKLGAGGMGEVFLAEDMRLGRPAAIKFLPAEMAEDEERRQRFFIEAKAASALNHPHVCVVYDVGETDDGLPFIAMEYVEGKSLDAAVAEGGLDISQVVEIAIQVADALDAAHDSRIIHRDIKPANITLNERGQVKVLDFGLAKRMPQEMVDTESATGEMVQTQEGQVLGTPAYMSPEQAVGKQVDHRSDLFSLGSVVYSLLTGRVPFPGDNLGEVLDNVRHRQPDAIARFNYDVPPELERITLKLLAKDIERRYQSARDLLVDLKNLSRDLQSATDPNHDAVSASRAAWDTQNLSAQPQPVLETEPPKPDDIMHSDVLISYADLDDQPLMSGHQGWVSQLHKNLQLRVAQLSGKQVEVVKQPDPSRLGEIEDEVLKVVPQAKTVVSILSPPFVKSNGCRRLVEAFWKGVAESGQLTDDKHSRLLKVIKTPVEEKDIPPEIRNFYSGLVPYEFFERDSTTGRLREFDEAFGSEAIQRFHERVYDVAYDVSQVLKYLGDAPVGGNQRTENPKTVFLAATTSDLEAQRDQLRRELVELGHEVLPKQPLPLVASDLMQVVRNCLEKSDVAIHFVGEHFGLVPEATELSVVALQNQVAATYCETAPLQRLIWIPKGLTPKDERQASFIRQLESEPRTVTGAELIADTLENLKVLLRSRWERERKQSEPAADRATEARRVYLICDQRDEESIEPLEDYFYSQGIEVSLPGFDADESEVQQIHIKNLSDCDAALIYYGAAGMHWVDFMIRDLQKAAGYRDSTPIPVSAVYLAPPFNRRKERFKSVLTEVLRQPDDQFDPGVLTDFVDSLRRIGEDHS